MTKRQFQQIANTFNKTKPLNPDAESERAFYQWQYDVMAMANMLKAHYPRFNQGQFLQACGYYNNHNN